MKYIVWKCFGGGSIHCLAQSALTTALRSRTGGDGGEQVAKGLPTPHTADGHVDFSGVYHAPGYGPGDPPIRGGETIARNIARGT